MRIVGLTFAKGTSTRLPRKNLLPFAGRPLVEWTLIAMRAARYLTDFYMVTESADIAEIAERHGFRIIWQDSESARTAGHYGAPVCEMLFFESVRGVYRGDDLLVTGLPTSPCRKPADIDEAVCKFLRTSAENPGKSVGVGTMVRRKDIQLMEDDAGSLKSVIFENKGRYLVTNGSISVRSMECAGGQAQEVPRLMEAFKAGTHYAGFANDPDIYAYTENEVWQQWDIDSRADFELCEQLFLANGLGDEAYKRYIGGMA